MNIQDKAFCDDVRARDAALRAWLGERNSYHPDELPAEINPPTNEERSRVELLEFVDDPPDRYTAYLSKDRKHITNFMGEILAAVTWEGPKHKIRRNCVTDERRTYYATGINGVRYTGAHNGPGMYLRMRSIK